MNDEHDTPHPAQEGAPVESQTPSDADVVSALRGEIERLRQDNSDAQDRALRALAEAENTRRRAERERGEFQKYAVTSFARDILPVADNMRRAIEALQSSLAPDSQQAGLIEGIAATERELLKALERHDIHRFDPVGQRFDPHSHEALSQVEMPQLAPDTIVHVVQAGYRIGERVLRPAGVIIAKGGLPGDTPEEMGGGDASASGGNGSAQAARDPDIAALLRPSVNGNGAHAGSGNGGHAARSILSGETLIRRSRGSGRSGLARNVLDGEPKR